MAPIDDVAKHAGVSPKTVSRVLNKDAPVSEKTRKAVAAAMDALGYVPSHAARSMKSNRSGLIGLITGDMVGSLLPMLRRTTLHMITGAALPLFRLLLI